MSSDDPRRPLLLSSPSPSAVSTTATTPTTDPTPSSTFYADQIAEGARGAYSLLHGWFRRNVVASIPGEDHAENEAQVRNRAPPPTTASTSVAAASTADAAPSLPFLETTLADGASEAATGDGDSECGRRRRATSEKAGNRGVGEEDSSTMLSANGDTTAVTGTKNNHGGANMVTNGADNNGDPKFTVVEMAGTCATGVNYTQTHNS